MATFTENISNGKKLVKEPQRKFEEEKQKKAQNETSRLAPIEEKLVQEANIGLQYADDAYVLDEEVQKLKSRDSMNDAKIKLAKNVLK